MGIIFANDAIRIKLKNIIFATGIIDAHAHHNSGATCPLPLIYSQVAENAADPSGVPLLKTREALEWFIAHIAGYGEGIRIQKLSTFDMGNLLANLNKKTFANIVGSMDFADEFARRKAGAQIASPVVAATMDMERAHIEGYNGQAIYHEENGELFYYKRSSGDKPENEGNKINLSHEIIVNKVDKTKTLKLQKWKRQHKETLAAAVNNPLHLLPLLFYDPRRYNRPSGTAFPESKDYGAWDEVFNYVATDSFSGIWFGIKMYPPLGHKPFDELCEYLPEFYHRCEKDKIPILTHCSPGGMTTHEAEFYVAFDIEDGQLSSRRNTALQKQKQKVSQLIKSSGRQPSNALGYPKEWGETTDTKRRFPMDYFFKYYVHPEAWRPVLENFPDLHLCLAHFGGDEWRRGPISSWSGSPPSEWIKSIVDLTKTYKNVYTDISCFDLTNTLDGEEDKSKCVRNTLNKMLHWMRDKDEYKHLKNKVLFGTDWYLTHLTRTDEGAEYGHYCRDFKRLIDQVDATFWIRFTLVNPWNCYSMTKEKLLKMFDALKKAGAKNDALNKNLDQLLKLDDEVSRIKEQLVKWDA